MRRLLTCLAFVLLLPAAASAAPRVGDEYIVLHTSAGDAVLALYPDVAPEHVKQLLHLVRLGVYNGTHFGRVEEDFVVQLSAANERMKPFTPEQKAALHTIQAEFSTLEHHRGILSMARADGQPDSAETSFSVIIGPRDRVKHLDGQYTVFGHVEAGLDVFDRMVAVPRDLPPKPPLPIVPLVVYKAEVVPRELTANYPLEPPHDIEIPTELLAKYRYELQRYVDSLPKHALEKETTRSATTYLVSGCVLVIIGLSLTSFFYGSRLPARWLGAFTLLNVLIGGFMLFALLGSMESQSIAAAVFFGMAGVFKLMSRFESA